MMSLGGRDGGGSQSGAASLEGSSDEEGDEELDGLEMGQGAPESPASKRPTKRGEIQPGSLARALRGDFGDGEAMADALGDVSDAEVEETDAEMGDARREKEEMEKIVEEEVEARSPRASVSK